MAERCHQVNYLLSGVQIAVVATTLFAKLHNRIPGAHRKIAEEAPDELPGGAILTESTDGDFTRTKSYQICWLALVVFEDGMVERVEHLIKCVVSDSHCNGCVLEQTIKRANRDLEVC